MAPLIDVPTDFTEFDLAEWAETVMVLEKDQSISRTAIAGMFPAGQGPDAAELDALFAEIRRRADTAPNVYPFRAVDELIVMNDEVDPTIYSFLLILSLESAPYRTENRFNEIGPFLELLTREAMLEYLGSGADAVRFGSDADGRPRLLAEAVVWLARRMGLEATPDTIAEDIDGDDKDGGIDVAAWHGFADGEPSFASFLIQCTTQVTYERKPADVTPDKWGAWIRFGKSPSVVLSIPFAIPQDAKVRGDLRYKVHLLLERFRICELLSKHDLTPYETDLSSMAQWTDQEIGRVQAAVTTARPPRLAKARRSRKGPVSAEPSNT
jgi:hypothetical protein